MLRHDLPCILIAIVIYIFLGTLDAHEKRNALHSKPGYLKDLYGDALPFGAIARLGTVRLYNSNRINSLVFSKDGRFIISGTDSLKENNCDGRRIMMWKRDHGLLARCFGNNSLQVSKLSLLPDGKTLISGGSNGIYFWDTTSGKQIRRLDTGKKNETTTFAISRDGNTMAMTGLGPHREKTKIQIWDMQQIKQIRTIDGGSELIAPLDLSPEGKFLATKSLSRGFITIWDVSTGKAIYNLKVDYITQISFSPDGRLLASEDEQGAIQFLESQTGKPIRLSKEIKIQKSDSDETCPFAFSPNSKRLAIASRAAGIRIFDISSGKTIWSRPCDYADWTVLAFSFDGKILACGTVNGWVRIWDVATGTETPYFAGHKSEVWSVAHLASDRLVSVAADGTVRLWNTQTGQEIKVLHRENLHKVDVFVGFVAAASNGAMIAASNGDGLIRLLEYHTGNLIRVLHGEGGYSIVSYSPDGKILAADGPEGSIVLWDPTTGKYLGRLTGLRKPKFVQRCLAFSPDGHLIATQDNNDAIIGIWDVASRKPRGRLIGHKDGVTSVIFTADSNYLISASEDNTLRLWNIKTGREELRFPLDPARVPTISALAISPDGRVLASAEQGFDGIIMRLWEVASGREICHFQGHTGEITSLSFSPDGRTVASGSRDCTILIWDALGQFLNPPPPAQGITCKQLEQLWQDLRDKNMRVAYRALRDLSSTPAETVGFLKERLSVVPVVKRERLHQLIADLDSDTFARREAASHALSRLGTLAESALRKALDNSPSAEMRRRVGGLLKALPGWVIKDPETLRIVRAIWVLQRIGTPEARALLEKLAAGAPASRQTQEAKIAVEYLDRIKKR